MTPLGEFSCLLRERGLCDRKCEENPRYVSYHARLDERPECYMKHMWLCSKMFDRKYPRYGPTFRRLLRKITGNQRISGKLIETSIRCMTALHDVGKLTQEYQEGRTGFRHEIPGFYIMIETNLLNKLTEKEDLEILPLKILPALAIYVMHEAMLIRYDKEWLRFPTAMELIANLDKWHYRFVDDYVDVVAETFRMFRLDASAVNAISCIRTLDGNAIALAVTKHMAISHAPNGPSIRLAVSSLVKFLKDVDNEAAKIGRKQHFNKELGVIKW